MATATKKFPDLSKMAGKIEDAVFEVMVKYANLIVTEAATKVSSSLVNASSSYNISQSREGGVLRVSITNNNDMIAFLEFGTGNPQSVSTGLSAEEYLSSQPSEVKEEAIKFFVTGEGTLAAQPHLFPTYYKYKDDIIRDADKAVQDIFNSI